MDRLYNFVGEIKELYRRRCFLFAMNYQTCKTPGTSPKFILFENSLQTSLVISKSIVSDGRKDAFIKK